MVHLKGSGVENAWISAADMIARIDADLEYPQDKRAASKWAILAACRWAEREPEVMPFTAKAMRETLARVSCGKAGVSRKTLQNARSAVEYVLRHYGSGTGSSFIQPLSEECAHWSVQLDKYQRASLGKLFCYISGRGLALSDVGEDVSSSFLTALEAELPGRKARAIHQGALLAWNRLGESNAAWPGRSLNRAGSDRERALPWSKLPGALVEAVEKLFANRSMDRRLFDGHSRRPLRATTIRNRKEHLRISASLLCQVHGVDPGGLTGLADLCRPDRFRLIIETIAARYGGVVTSYVEQIAVTLLQAAEEGACLSPDEIERVRVLKRKVYRQRQHDQKTEVHRDQAVLNELDDAAAINRLLALPSRAAKRVIQSPQRDERAALNFQLATALSVMLAAPLRISNFASLSLDEHVGKITSADATRFIIRVSGEETKNGKPIEHILDDEAAALLDTYLIDYRPVLAPPGSRWLWPGYGGRHKHPHVLSRQLAAFVKEGAGIDFHPHLMRKVAVKIILDSNPAAIEVARMMLGHTDTRPTRSAYVQSQVRSAQAEYAKALMDRRLGALDTLTTRTRRAAAPVPLKVGKGRRLLAGADT